MICSLVNNFLSKEISRFQTYTPASATILSGNDKQTAEQLLASLKYRDKSTLTKTEKKIIKKEFKKQLGIYVKAKLKGDRDQSSKAGLIILSIIAAVGLLYLVAALACNLSCNGMDGAAIIFALHGNAAVVIGLVLLIRSIKKGPQNKPQAP